MGKTQFNLGIIGCGFVAEQQARALSMVPEIRIVGLADRRPESTANFKAKMKLDNDVRCFQDYRELLAMDNLDFVSISAPNRAHREMLCAAAEAGKHVLCEKPPANNLRDADEMVAIMDQRDLKFGVYHEALFYPENLLIRQLFEQDSLGTAKFVWLGAFGWSKWILTSWRLDPTVSGGGAVMDEGTHLAHLAKVYFRQRPVCVSAFIDRLRPEWSPVEDTGVMTFEFPSGIAQANTSSMPMIGRNQNMKTYSQGIITDKLSIELLFGDAAEGVFSPVKSVLVTTPSGVTEHRMPFYSGPLEKNAEAFKRLYTDFVHSVIHNRAPNVDGKSARDALEMVMAAYESAALGRAVRLPLDPASPVYQEGVLGLKKLDAEIGRESIFKKKSLYGFGPVQSARAEPT